MIAQAVAFASPYITAYLVILSSEMEGGAVSWAMNTHNEKKQRIESPYVMYTSEGQRPVLLARADCFNVRLLLFPSARTTWT